ncbi:glycosyltransferase family 4 protein [Haloplasma contractile]|nr:glycosyltransferase family 4 protein [Haloplasma contractile]
MNILVVSQYYHPEPFRITDICESLVKKDHNVTVLTGLPNYPEGKVLPEYKFGKNRYEIINGVIIKRTFEIGRGNCKSKLFLNYFSFSISASIKAYFTKDKYDVILFNQLSPIMSGIPALVYKKRHKKKILLYCLDLWPASLAAGGLKKDSIIYNLFHRISKFIYKSADKITVTSSMFKQYFENTLEINSNDIDHLPQYAEDLFSEKYFSENNSTYAKNTYDFVFAGNIGDMQSVETIIKAAYELKDYKNIIFHIVGDGSKLNQCKKLIKTLSLKSVKLYGRRPLSDMPKFYSKADAMLVTLKDNDNISNTLPGKIQSYMAFGKPIIGAINGEGQKVIQDSECGFCCDAEDYKSLAKLILKFSKVDNKEILSKNSYNYYNEKYNKEIFIKKLEEALIELEDK